MPVIKWHTEDVQVEITSSKIVKSEKKGEFVIYQVTITDGENSWVVQHRFRSFENLRVIVMNLIFTDK